MSEWRSERIRDAYEPRNGERLVGDDLTEDMLDELWAGPCTGRDPTPTRMSAWWADKKHQILYRLVCRLTRAECELAEARAKLGRDEEGA